MVTLLEGTREVGSATLDANGDAKVAASNLPAGSHSLHAVFTGAVAGDSEFDSSSSVEAQVTAEATGVADFTVAAKPTTISVPQGSTATAIITLAPTSGFSGYVTLSCSQLVTDSNCNFVPANVFVGGTTSSPSTLSVETYGVTTSLRSHSQMVYAFLLPGLLGLAGLGMRRRKPSRHSDWLCWQSPLSAAPAAARSATTT